MKNCVGTIIWESDYFFGDENMIDGRYSPCMDNVLFYCSGG